MELHISRSRSLGVVEAVEGKTLEVREGDVLVRILRCALTANNVSYALSGESLGYFNFFPTGVADRASVPSWGFAEVVCSRHPEVTVGERLYGFFPYHEYVVLCASTVSAAIIVDRAPHRKDLATIYNTYNRVSSGLDELYGGPALEDLTMVLRPLFLTSWLLRDFALGNVKPARVVLTSASSKTAYALAYLLQKTGAASTAKGGDAPRVVGLTSARNKAFVEGLGFYDEVIVYDEVRDALAPEAGAAAAAAAGGTLLVDFAGSQAVVEAVLAVAPEATVSLVGATDWEASSGRTGKMPGTFFFAPTYAVEAIKRMGEADFGAAVAEDFTGFLEYVQANAVCTIQHVHGSKAVEKAFREALDGSSGDPSRGTVVSMFPASLL